MIFLFWQPRKLQFDSKIMRCAYHKNSHTKLSAENKAKNEGRINKTLDTMYVTLQVVIQRKENMFFAH